MKKIIAACLLLFSQTAWAQANLPDYLQDLYSRSLPAYEKIKSHEYDKFCEEFSIDKKNKNNRKYYHQILFFHDLLTGSYCINFATGGMLEIPYLFHWIDPNPRHEITYMPDSVKLNTVKPPSDFSRYKTYADIDRVPALYLGDLFSGAPKYFHRSVGKFHTFGWCSEREMAYNTLLDIYGYKCKIKQEGIHTWSEVWIPFEKKDKTISNLKAYVDNSVDIVEWNKLPSNANKNQWRKDIGSGTQIKWYNRIAHSNSQKNKLNTINVSKDAIQWIENSVSSWLTLNSNEK